MFPETAIRGYDFTDPAQRVPCVDTISGRATDARMPLLRHALRHLIAGKDGRCEIFRVPEDLAQRLSG